MTEGDLGCLEAVSRAEFGGSGVTELVGVPAAGPLPRPDLSALLVRQVSLSEQREDRVRERLVARGSDGTTERVLAISLACRLSRVHLPTTGALRRRDGGATVCLTDRMMTSDRLRWRETELGRIAVEERRQDDLGLRTDRDHPALAQVTGFMVSRRKEPARGV